MSVDKKYVGGFSVRGKSDYDTVEWLLDRNESNQQKLQFLAYDANLSPLPDMTYWQSEEWKEKQIKEARKFTKDFNGEVWLDSIFLYDEKTMGV